MCEPSVALFRDRALRYNRRGHALTGSRKVHGLRPVICAVLSAVVFTAVRTATAEEPQGETALPASQEEGRIRKVGPHLYQVGSVVLDAESRTVRCPGRVNMNEGGPIELLACLSRGKTHESVFTLDVEPMDLQVALLLLGMKEGRNPAAKYAADDPNLKRPAGDEAVIFVEWCQPKQGEGQDAALKRCRAEELLTNVRAEGPTPEMTWAFLGSRIVDGTFGAEREGSLITTFHDPLAILELAFSTVNDDIYYFVNKDRCPPVDTLIELVIQAPPKEQEPADEANGEKPEAEQPQETG